MRDHLHDSILEKLIADSGSPELAEQLAPLVREVICSPAAAPVSQGMDRLVKEIHHQIYLHQDRRPLERRIHLFGVILQSQIRIVRSEIWISSLFILILGFLVTFFTYSSMQTLPFVLFSPIIAAIGLSFIYGTETDPALEIELSTPISAQTLLSARLTLVFGFDLILAVLASVLIVGVHSDLSFWPFVSLWLGPMAFLSALVFLSAVLSNNTGLGVLLSFGSWILLNLVRFVHFSQTIGQSYDLLISSLTPFLLLASLAMIVMGLLSAGNAEHELREN